MLNILKINLTVKSSCLSLLIIKSNLEELLTFAYSLTVQYRLYEHFILFFSNYKWFTRKTGWMPNVTFDMVESHKCFQEIMLLLLVGLGGVRHC